MPETLVPETLVPERAGKERGMSDGDGPETGETAMSNAFARAGYTVPGVETPSDDGPEPRHYASPTAAVLDHAALYGATPDPGEPDNRPVWDETEGRRRHRAGRAHADRERRPRRHPARRRAREPAVGVR